MPVQTLISVGEYLSSSYEYDKEYVDGELIERGMPTAEHGELQAALCGFVFAKRKEWRIKVVTEVRIQVSAEAYRVADFCIVSDDNSTKGAIRVPPICVIEILSPNDGFGEIRSKAQDYRSMGIRHVWSVFPVSGECYEHLENFMKPVEDRVLRIAGTAIEIPVAEIIASL